MMAWIVSLGLIAVLAAVIYFDLRHMRIPNQLSLILIVLFAGLALTLPMSEIAVRLAQSMVVFVFCFTFFALRLMGGGDVKILACLTLFVPLSHASEIMLGFSAGLMGCTLLIVLARKVLRSDGSDWAFLKTAKMPMGVPIGMSGIGMLGWSMLSGV